MILKGAQRSGALKLAAHLLRLDENDHVEMHELRGFSADDLRGALQEADAIAKGTRCRQFLISLSFNPPGTERSGARHRHAHVVWSRIDIDRMKAINLPFYKMKLKDVSKELFLEHGWRLPEGLRNRENRNPQNFSREEWQQAKRAKQDAQALKVTFQECWAVSDNRASFERALEDQGFLLARGDRRGVVAVDFRGEAYSLSRWTGAKSKALKDKLGDPNALPDVAQVRTGIAERMTSRLQEFIRATEREAEAVKAETARRKAEMRTRQRADRDDLQRTQAERQEQEAVARAARFRNGLGGLWDWVTGRSRAIRKQNEVEARIATERDAAERDATIATQLSDRQSFQRDLRQARREVSEIIGDLRRDVALYLGWRQEAATAAGQTWRSREFQIDR